MDPDQRIRVAYSTPLLHVAEIETSIRFYELLDLPPWTNVIFVGHWGRAEQEAWEKRISQGQAQSKVE